MRIVLIKPDFKLPNQRITPPRGIAHLAAYLREKLKPAPETIIYDQAVLGATMDDLEKFLVEKKPDIVGITGLTFEAPRIKEIAALSRKLFPNVSVVVGGPHATVFFDNVLETMDADVAVMGEGEETFLDLVGKIRDGRDWRNSEGIAYLGPDGKIVVNPSRPAIADLDTIPYPAWDLLDVPAYSRRTSMNDFVKATPYMMFFSSRACPYGCLYCHQIFGKKFRARSVESAMGELRILVRDYGIKEIHIIDDIFNYDADRAKEICRKIIAEKLNIKIAFPNGIRGDRLDDELIELLAEAGCYSMTFAVETATPRLQKLLRKHADLEKLTWAIDKADSVGIIPKGFFMLGFPTETLDEINATIDFACRSKILVAGFFSVVPFPRTALYDLFRETYPKEFEKGLPDLEKMHYHTSDTVYSRVTGIDLESIVVAAHRRFYMNPRRIVKLLIKVPKNRVLLWGLYRGVSVSFSSGRKLDRALVDMKRKRAEYSHAGGHSR